MPVCFICVFFFLVLCTVYCNEKELENNMTPYKPRHEKTRKPKQHICSKCILLDLYVRVFLEPNKHGYIVYMFVYTCILDIWVRVYMSRDMTKPTKWLWAQRRLWSESSLSAWRSSGSLATHWAHSKDSGKTGRMPRLIWVFAGRTLILLVFSCRGSYVHIKTFLISAI